MNNLFSNRGLVFLSWLFLDLGKTRAWKSQPSAVQRRTPQPRGPGTSQVCLPLLILICLPMNQNSEHWMVTTTKDPVYLYGGLCWWMFIYRTIQAFLGWSLFDLDEWWCLWCAPGLGLCRTLRYLSSITSACMLPCFLPSMMISDQTSETELGE